MTRPCYTLLLVSESHLHIHIQLLIHTIYYIHTSTHAHTTTTLHSSSHTFSPLLLPLTHPLSAFSLDTLKAMPGIGEKLSSGPMGMILNNMGGNSNSNSNSNNSSANSTKNLLTVKDYDLQELRKLSQAVFFETISASYLHFVTKVITHTYIHTHIHTCIHTYMHTYTLPSLPYTQRKLSQAVFFETISASYLHFVTKVTTHIPCQYTLWTPTYPETHTLSSYLHFVTKVTNNTPSHIPCQHTPYEHTLSTKTD